MLAAPKAEHEHAAFKPFGAIPHGYQTELPERVGDVARSPAACVLKADLVRIVPPILVNDAPVGTGHGEGLPSNPCLIAFV